ncbi:MAG TPA: hypothetical protein VL200_08405 [Lacunisphaera sp.]|jgi:hypothetical protein|nr:hypothetical protein [Lacunisphaera sp.]
MSRRGVAAIVLFWSACVFGWLALLWTPRRTVLDLDEVYWIGSSYYYQLAFVLRDWRSPHWDLLPARENPPVAKYCLGLGLSLAGHPVRTIEPLAYFYDYWARQPGQWGDGQYAAKRDAAIAAGSGAVLRAAHESRVVPLTLAAIHVARGVTVLAVVLAAAATLALGTITSDWIAGWLAGQLLLLHPVLVSVYNHAMSDAFALLFSMAAALAGYHWFARAGGPWTWRRGLGVSMFTGALLGLACGAKMNSLVLVLLMGWATVAAAWSAWRRPAAGGIAPVGILGLGLAILASALAVFVGLNPAILHDPVGGLLATASEHFNTEQAQAVFLGGHLTTLAAKTRTLAELAFGDWPAFVLVAAIVIVGLVRHGREPGFRFLFAWWLIALACVTVWLPFGWSRYVLPVLPPTFLLVGRVFAGAVRAVPAGGGLVTVGSSR